MTKDEVRTQLSAYLDGELGEAERREVEAALAADAALRAELDQLRRTAELVRSLPRRAAPAGFAGRVHAAIAAPRRAPRPWLPTWRPATVAAAACLLLSLALLLMPRPGGRRHVARDATPVRELAGDAAKGESAATAGPTTAPGREGPAAESTGKVGKLTSNRTLLARAEGDKASGERHNGVGYVAAPAAPAPAEKPARADGKGTWSGRGAGAASKPGVVAPRKATGPVEEEPAPADDGRKDRKFAEMKVGVRPAPAPPTAMGEVAATVETLEEKAKRDSEADATTPARLRKAGETGDEAQDPLAGEKRRAVDRRALVEAIEREYRFGDETARRAQARPAAGAAGNLKQAAGQLEVRLAYTDLARCLADWRAALDAANLAYAVRPVGGGQFVIETTLPEPEAHALLARLAGPARAKGQEKKEEQAAPEPAREKQKTVAAAAMQGAQNAPVPTVHLVLHFARAEGEAGAPPAEPAERSEPKK